MKGKEDYFNSDFDIELDLKLKQIIKQIKSSPQPSLQRKRAINLLLITIQNSGKLVYPQKNKGSWSETYYQDLLDQAISITFESIAKSIDKYNFRYAVMQWVNGILKNRFIDVLRTPKTIDTVTIDNPDKPIIIPDKPKEKILETSEVRQQCIENNPIFDAKHIRNKPQATIGRLIIMKYFEGKTFEQIASQFQIGRHTTISGFLYRELNNKKSKILDALRKCLQEELNL